MPFSGFPAQLNTALSYAISEFTQNAGKTRHSFTEEQLGLLKVPLPPLPEQSAIAAFLDSKCIKIDELIFEKRLLIEDLESYKKSLIYEVVTGKRKVG